MWRNYVPTTAQKQVIERDRQKGQCVMPEGKYLSAFPKEGNRIPAINDFMQPD